MRAIRPCHGTWLSLGLMLSAGFAAVPPPPPPAIIGTLPDMPKGVAVTGRDDGLSVKIGAFNCFLFGDTMLTRTNSVGDTWVVNTMYHTADTDPDDGLVPGFNWKFSGQPPLQFVPYTAEEQAYKHAHKNTDRYVHGIWPMGQFYSPGDSKHYITFSKVIERPGLVWVDIGSGLAVLPQDPINDMATRVQSRPGHPEDYLMWDSTERDWGHMCAVLGDYVYSYHVEGQNFGALRVARAYLKDGSDAGDTLDFLEKSNWQYWNGSTWVTDPLSASVLFYGTGVGTIDWNAYLPNEEGGNGCYLFTYLGWVSTNICVRTSSDLIHWSAERVIATVPNIPSGTFPYFGRAHYGLEKERGRIIYISYCRPLVQFPIQDIPMIRAEFPRPALETRLTPTNTMVLRWPASFGSGFVLQEKLESAGGAWTASSAPVNRLNGNNQAVIPAEGAARFYRLILP
jgi:hypothetical protein